MHPKQLHTGSKRGCSCNYRTIPLCCGFQLLDSRRQHCSGQKLLTIKAAASVSQERQGGTKTSYITRQRTSHQQEGEFYAFSELLPLSCIPPSVHGTEPLSEAGLTMCSFSPTFLSQKLLKLFLSRPADPQHIGFSSPSCSREATGMMEKKLPAESSTPLHFGQKTLARSVLILKLLPLKIDTVRGQHPSIPGCRACWLPSYHFNCCSSLAQRCITQLPPGLCACLFPSSLSGSLYEA